MIGGLDNLFVSPGFLVLIAVVFVIMLVLGFADKKSFVFRFIVFALLIVALAEPYSPVNIFGEVTTKLAIIYDRSKSFEVFEGNYGEDIYERIKGSNIEHGVVGDGVVSNLGDGLISKIKEKNNILIVSDGNINSGVDFGEVVVEANKKNVSVNLVEPVVKNDDYYIEIKGPSKVVPEVDSIFNVVVKGTDNGEKNVVLYVDGKEVKRELTNNMQYKSKFESGYHHLKAEIKDDDYFGENNVYYKVVKVVEKSNVLFYGDTGSPLHKVIGNVNDVVTGNLNGLSRYHAVVVDNKNLAEVQSGISELESFVRDGNGLIVFGGRNSFEYGSYKESSFEKLLPVIVSGTEKKEGNINVVLVIDISRSTGGSADLQKSLAISSLDEIGVENNLGVMAFDSEAYVVEPLGLLIDKNVDEIKSKISSLEPGGSTEIGKGINEAVDVLENRAGGKNVILITDGKTQRKDDAFAAINRSARKGVRIYTIGVGEDPESTFLEMVSRATNAQSFNAIQSSKIAFLFGDPDKKKDSDYNVAVEDNKHFITEDLIFSSSLYGFNEVAPKNSAQLLVSADGNSIVSVWRVGLGRVAVVATDSGDRWGGELYSGTGASLIRRTINWGAGDPERKDGYFVEVGDARVGEEFEIIVKGDKKPNFEGMKFDRKGEDLYSANVVHKKSGFFTAGKEEYAVNYNSEYSKTGLNNGLKELVSATGGKVFTKSEAMKELRDYLKPRDDVLHSKKETFVWPLVLMALLIFLLDVWVSRVKEYKNI